MNLTTIAEHTLCLDLLPERANVLDLGCRGFLFANELRRLGHNVVCVDMDTLEPGGRAANYYQKAITNRNGFVYLQRERDPQATRIALYEGQNATEEVECMTLETFSAYVNIPFWDAIKVDIEGAEYDVIMSLKQPLSKQLSIEFHLHTSIYGIRQMAEMHDKLRDLGYTAVQHEMTKQHGLSLNFWDSLFILQ